MIISVVNHTNGMLSDADLQKAIRAINRQIAEDFAPYWGMSATMRLEGRSSAEPDKITVPDMRGDAVLYVWDKSDLDDAIGYHFRNNRGIPYGFVFLDIARALGDENGTITLSHEALELIADPECNLLVLGPHPAEDRFVFHWFEMCDAVQAETYEIDGIRVSNFVLPLYFTGSRDADEIGARNDFLGTIGTDGLTLQSFGINAGGYVGFFDPEKQEDDTFSVRGDASGPARLAAKRTVIARRAIRQRDPRIRAQEEKELTAAGSTGDDRQRRKADPQASASEATVRERRDDAGAGRQSATDPAGEIMKKGRESRPFSFTPSLASRRGPSPAPRS
jgi:hypothetical protein